jgi:hypothetical protein
MSKIMKISFKRKKINNMNHELEKTVKTRNFYNLFQNQKSTNTAFYLENTTDNVANFCF